MHLAMRPTPCTTGQVHLLVYYIKLKSRLSVRTFLVVSFSAVASWINVILLYVIAMSSGMAKFIFKSF